MLRSESRFRFDILKVKYWNADSFLACTKMTGGGICTIQSRVQIGLVIRMPSTT
jgi:hypothetical protein